MKFFLPDSQDLVDPSFDFESESRHPDRQRDRDDRYIHEIMDAPPFDGLLVSMGIVENYGKGTSRYSQQQRDRLKQQGAQQFFRLPSSGPRLGVMGDCGAFSYLNEPEPPFDTIDVVKFYEHCGFDYGVAVDHMIFGFDPGLDYSLPFVDIVPPEWRRRQHINLERGREFLTLCAKLKVSFEPIGVAHGWSPKSYAEAFNNMQAMGYETIALGSVVPLSSEDILAILKAIDGIRRPTTKIHLLGVSRLEHASTFAKLGVVSFDSTSPLKQAFMSERDNYHTEDRTFAAIRIPQVNGNPSLIRMIKAGRVDKTLLLKHQQTCLETVSSFNQGKCSADELLDAIHTYETAYDATHQYASLYRETLEAAPWEQCPCAVCQSLGIHVALFRGAERNRRRGFHNVYVMFERLKKLRSEWDATTLP